MTIREKINELKWYRQILKQIKFQQENTVEKVEKPKVKVLVKKY